MPGVTRRSIITGASVAAASTMAAGTSTGADERSAETGDTATTPAIRLSREGWDADAPPELTFLFEARVNLHLPPITVGDMSDGSRIIFRVKDGTFEGPSLRGRVVPDSGADWIRIRPDGTGILDVRFCLQTHDNALLYVYWQGRFWSTPENTAYAFDVNKPDDPSGAWRYYFRTVPLFETGDPKYAWLNSVVAISKSRTGDGGPIHRVYAVR